MENQDARIIMHKAHMRCFGHAPLIEIHAHIIAPNKINGERIP